MSETDGRDGFCADCGDYEDDLEFCDTCQVRLCWCCLDDHGWRHEEADAAA